MKKIAGLSKEEKKRIFKFYLSRRRSILTQKAEEEEKVNSINMQLFEMISSKKSTNKKEADVAEIKIDNNEINFDDNELTYLIVKKSYIKKIIKTLDEELQREGTPITVYLTLSKMR